MSDAFGSLHGYQNHFPTHSRGSVPIDTVLVSPDIALIKGGYLEQGSFPSDHCPIWIDVDIERTFGSIGNADLQWKARRFQTSDPSAKAKFITNYSRIIRANDLHKRASELRKASKGNWSPEYAEEYESLDRIKVEAMLASERKCKRLRVGKVPFSPEVQSVRNEIRLWQVVLSRKKGSRVSTRYISKLERKAKKDSSLSHTTQQVAEKLRQAFMCYKTLKKKAILIREEWLKGLAREVARKGNRLASQEYMNLVHREKNKRTLWQN